MREFTNKSLWDTENQEWVDLYYIDNQEVDVDTFTEQLKVEEEIDNEDILENEDHPKECQCVHCKSSRGEFTEDEERDISLVEHFADLIEASECECGGYLRNNLFDLLCIGKGIGYDDCKNKVNEFLDD